MRCVDLGESFPTVPFSQSSLQIDPNSNEYLFSKFGFDTAGNEPRKVCPLSAYRSPPGVAPPVETEPNAKKPPLIDNAATRKVEYEMSLHMTNPLQENSPWAKIGVPIVLGMFGLTVIILAALFIGSKSDDVDENELELPENMYGELFATTVITTFRYRRDGLRLPAVCEFFSSVVLILVTRAELMTQGEMVCCIGKFWKARSRLYQG